MLDTRVLDGNPWQALACWALGQHLSYLAGEVVAENPDHRWNERELPY